MGSKTSLITFILLSTALTMSSAVELEKWMTNFQDKLLWSLVLPGTHDSASNHF